MWLLERYRNLMKPKDDAHDAFEEAFSDSHAGYVLITCAQADKSGQMEVKMTYGGGCDLANMLIDGAQTLLEDELEPDDESKLPHLFTKNLN